MSQVETVALWVGLIASVAGIVLSIAALVFGVWVNNRATEVNNQTIRSLQKIESAVERLSDDTRNLIKAGWDKMLGDFGDDKVSTAESIESARDMASGFDQEARLELGLNGEGTEKPQITSAEQVKRLEKVLAGVEEMLTTQLGNARFTERPSRGVDRAVKQISALSPDAQALLAELVNARHLTRKQYKDLTKNPRLGSSVRELRKSGFLVPLSGTHLDGHKIPVYWLPGGIVSPVKAAIQLLPNVAKEHSSMVSEELNRVRHQMPE